MQARAALREERAEPTLPGMASAGPFDRLGQFGRALLILAAGQLLSYGTTLASAGWWLLFLVVGPAYFALGFAASRWLGASLPTTILFGAAAPFVIQTSAMAVLLGI